MIKMNKIGLKNLLKRGVGTALLLAVFAMPALALVNTTVTITPDTIEQGSTVVAELSIASDAGPVQVYAVDLYVSYDPAVFNAPTVTDYAEGTWFIEQVEVEGGLNRVKYSKGALPPGSAGLNLTVPTKMYKLEFVVKSDAPLGAAQLSSVNGFLNIVDENYQEITGSFTSTTTGIVNPVVTVDPTSGIRGATGLAVTLTGQNTSFTGGYTAHFVGAAGITVTNTQVNNATEIVATIDIAADADLAAFDVEVRNGAGAVLAKGTDIFTVTANLTPGVPTNLNVAAPGPAWATPSWDAVAGATLYRVIYSVNADLSNPTVVTTDETWVTINGLDVETTYYTAVRAENQYGESAYTAAVAFATLAVQTPTNLSVAGIEQTQATPSWYASDGATGYTVSYGTNAAADNLGTVTTTETWYDLKGLTDNTTYYVKVRADNQGKTSSAYTVPVSFNTTQVPPPAVPTGLKVEGIASNLATPSWDAVVGATLYRVILFPNKPFVPGEEIVIVATTETWVTIKDLDVETTYYVMVRAENQYGNSNYTDPPVEFDTLAVQTPTNFSVAGIDKDTATPSWYASNGATGYTLSIGTDTGATNLGTIETTDTWHVLLNLTPGTTYYAKVRADNTGKASSAYTSPVEFITLVDDKAIISLNPTELSFEIEIGSSITGETIELANTGNAVLNYTVTTSANWLVSVNIQLTDSGAVSPGAEDTLIVGANPATLFLLNPGVYTAEVIVTDAAALNSPQKVTVTVNLLEGSGDNPPVISELTPTRGPSGTPITIKGYNFGATAQGRKIIFESPSTGVIIPVSSMSWSNTEITIKAPPLLVAGDYQVSVSEKNSINSDSNDDQLFKVMSASTKTKAYPNPFNPFQETLKIEVIVTETTDVQVYLYDMTGQPMWKSGMQTLIAGTHIVPWDGITFFADYAGDGVVLIRVVNEGNKSLISKGKALIIKR